jgi:hypothetical protein
MTIVVMQHHHHDGNDEQDDEEVGLPHPSFLLMMPNVWLKFQAPIVMGMVAVALTIVATSHEGMTREREKRKGHEPPCVFFLLTKNLWGT